MSELDTALPPEPASLQTAGEIMSEQNQEKSLTLAEYSQAGIIKKAHALVNYSKLQLDELKKCYDPINGPRHFMENYMWIQHPTRGRQQFSPYDFQVDLIDTYHNHRKSINMVSRQMGKTTVAAGYLLWYAMFTDDANILIASRNHDGALDIMQRVRYAYENMPDFIRAGAVTYNQKQIEFDNRSRITATATTVNTGRGMSLSLIYLDEFAFVEGNIAKEFWTALSPTLSTGGKVIITSTPDTDEDQFAQLWFTANQLHDEFGNETEVGPNGFRPYFADWTAHPERDEAWAAEQLADLLQDRFSREHECKFITFEETLISASLIAKHPGINPLRKSGQIRWYSKINPEYTYAICLDPAMGTGGDNAAIQVYELPTLKQVAEWQHNRTNVEGQIKIMRDIAKEIYSFGEPEIYWSVENNGMGEAALVVIRDTGEENIPGSFLHDPKNIGKGRRKGFTTTNKNKLEACSRFKSLYETGKLQVNSKNLISEMKVFISRGSTYEARPGYTDDLVMSTLLFVRMAEFISSWDDESWEKLNTSIIDGAMEDDYVAPMPVVFV